MMLRRIFKKTRWTGLPVLLVILLLPGLLVAADAEVTASVNAEKIGIDDVLLYTLSFKGISNPPQPDLSGLKTFRVAQSSSSFRTEIINGVMSQTIEFTFYLLPTQTGALNIPPYTYTHEGKEYKTRAFTIVVVQGSVATPAPRRPSIFDDDDFFAPFSRRPQQQQPQEVDTKLKARVSKQTVVKGEQIIYEVLLYTRNNIQSFNPPTQLSFPGFWQEWYPTPRSIESEIETLDGKQYRVFKIAKAVLFPNETGKVTIPSLRYELLLRNDTFSIFSEPQKIIRSTPEIALTVEPLPAGAEGIPVGTFDFNVSADKQEIDINDILTLRVRISGKGNTKTMNVPGFETGNYFKVYPEKISRDSETNDDSITGWVEAEIPVSFKETGLISFPGLSFRFYDPAQGRVITLNSNPFHIKVTGTLEKQEESASTIPRTEIVKTGEDIDFIKNGEVYDQLDNFYKTGLFMFLALILFFLNLFYVLKIVIVDNLISRSETLKKKKLINRTINRLRAIREYGEIFPVIESYLQGKTGLGLAEINNYSIEAVFDKYGVSGSDIKTFVRIKSESESSRFSPVKKSGEELKHDLKILIDILKRIDSKIK